MAPVNIRSGLAARERGTRDGARSQLAGNKQVGGTFVSQRGVTIHRRAVGVRIVHIGEDSLGKDAISGLRQGDRGRILRGDCAGYYPTRFEERNHEENRGFVNQPPMALISTLAGRGDAELDLSSEYRSSRFAHVS